MPESQQQNLHSQMVEIVEMYPLIFGHCLRFLQNTDDPRANAEDATMNIIARAIRALPRFRGEAKLSTWVLEITTNCCIDLRGKQARKYQKESSYDWSADDVSREHMSNERALASSMADPAVIVEVKGLFDEVFLYLRARYPGYFEALMLFIVGMGYKEIAKILKIPLGTVKSRIHRVRMAAREYAINRGIEPALITKRTN